MENEFFAELESQQGKGDNFGVWDDTGDIPVLRLQYDSEHPEFARGVQVGMIWQILNSEIDEFEIPVYASNAEMIMRMTESTNYSFSVRFEGNDLEGEEAEWMIVLFKAN
jgi:hypothetical protein